MSQQVATAAGDEAGRHAWCLRARVTLVVQVRSTTLQSLLDAATPAKAKAELAAQRGQDGSAHVMSMNEVGSKPAALDVVEWCTQLEEAVLAPAGACQGQDGARCPRAGARGAP
eukprot:scaffold2321_cov329-Prasinococcus_capsulatus_cf.AAC.10